VSKVIDLLRGVGRIKVSVTGDVSLPGIARRSGRIAVGIAVVVVVVVPGDDDGEIRVTESAGACCGRWCRCRCCDS
jgi:hypothetical protein